MVDASNKRVHVVFSGRVQGVGFRYTAVEIAETLDVKGWVRNLSGGEVEIVAEQKQDILENFIAHIEREFSGYIKSKDVAWEPATGEFRDFSVSY